MSPEPRNPYVHQWSLGVQRQVTREHHRRAELRGQHGAQPADADRTSRRPSRTARANPTVAGRKPFPNFGVYIDSDWSGTSKYNALNAKVEHHGRAAARHLRLHLVEEHRQQVGRRGHRRIGLQRLAGLPEQPRPGPATTASPTSTWTIARWPASSGTCPSERASASPAMPPASRTPSSEAGRSTASTSGSADSRSPIQAADLGERPRQLRHQPGERLGRHPSGRRDHRAVVQHRAPSPSRPSASSATRAATCCAGPAINNLDLALFKNFDLPRGALLQFRFESFNAFNHPQFTRRADEHDGADLRPSSPQARAGTDQPARVEADLVGRACRPAGSPTWRAIRLPAPWPASGSGHPCTHRPRSGERVVGRK